MNLRLPIILFSAALATALPVAAHTQWIKPNHFNAALGKNPFWLTTVMGISEHPFSFERNLATDTVTVTLPSGEHMVLKDIKSTKAFSAFDYQLTQAGTYKFEAFSGPTVRKPRKPKGKDGSKRPITKTVSRLTSYVTADAPNDTVLKPSNTWLEIVPLTHPADMVAQEPATFKVLFNGKPLADTEVQLVPSGGEYRDDNAAQSVTTDAQGMLSVIPSKAGVYLIKTNYAQMLKDDPEAQQLRASAGLTFEAQIN